MTAFDLDVTVQNRVHMDKAGQKVMEVSKDECLRMWQTATKCKCAERRKYKSGYSSHVGS